MSKSVKLMYQLDNQKLWLEIIGCIEAINKDGFDIWITWIGYGIVTVRNLEMITDFRDIEQLHKYLLKFIEDNGVLTDGTSPN